MVSCSAIKNLKHQTNKQTNKKKKKTIHTQEEKHNKQTSQILINKKRIALAFALSSETAKTVNSTEHRLVTLITVLK